MPIGDPLRGFGGPSSIPTRKTPEEKNEGTRHIHPCCENNLKLVITDQTIHKVWMAFWKVGISYEDAMIVVDEMQKSGILFREETKEGS